MKALTVHEADKLRVEEVGPPRLPAGQARIRVKYAGVGFADVMAVRGGYPLAPRRPFSPGYEFFGTVVEAGTSSLDAGQRVAGMLPRMGAYRELIDVDPRYAVPVPPDLGDESAALLPLNYLTALAMIERCARLQRGRSFLIHGAAGGVGTAALELARLLGLRAFGSASGTQARPDRRPGRRSAAPRGRAMGRRTSRARERRRRRGLRRLRDRIIQALVAFALSQGNPGLLRRIAEHRRRDGGFRAGPALPGEQETLRPAPVSAHMRYSTYRRARFRLVPRLIGEDF